MSGTGNVEGETSDTQPICPSVNCDVSILLQHATTSVWQPLLEDKAGSAGSPTPLNPFPPVPEHNVWTCSICFDIVERTKVYNRIVRQCCRLWQQSRMLLRQCCWCGRGLRVSNCAKMWWKGNDKGATRRWFRVAEATLAELEIKPRQDIQGGPQKVIPLVHYITHCTRGITFFAHPACLKFETEPRTRHGKHCLEQVSRQKPRVSRLHHRN